MKRILYLIVTAALALPAFSQQMLIEKNSGGSSAVELENLRRITFNGNAVNLTLNDGTSIASNMSDISRIYFDGFSGIKNIGKEETFITYISADEIVVNCRAGETINIYNINGSLVTVTRQQSDSGCIGIAQLPKGIYLIQAGEKTAKFVKR